MVRSPQEIGQPSRPPVSDQQYADWDEIYRDNVERLYRLMYSKVGNRPDAEDLTAEVFLAALKPLRTAASRGEVRSYLAATARTVLAGFWRRRLGVQVTSIDTETAALCLEGTFSRSPMPRHEPGGCWTPCRNATGASSSCASSTPSARRRRLEPWVSP
jgi:DNA-directed RNA polymerase specialized sigma24 family protein